MFQSKYFRYGFFGFLIAAALFYIWDKSLFEYRLRSQPITMVLERSLKVSPNTAKVIIDMKKKFVTLDKDKTVPFKSLNDLLKGQNTILMIWSPTCPYCIEQLKKLDNFGRRYKKINVATLGVYGDIKEAFKKHKENNKGDFAFDDDATFSFTRTVVGDLIQDGGGFPFFVFFNSKGEVIARTYGSIPWDQVGDDIAHAKFR